MSTEEVIESLRQAIKDAKLRRRVVAYIEELSKMEEKKTLSEIVPTFTLPEVSDALGIDIRTLRDHIRRGKLKARKIGRQYFVTAENFRAYVEPTDKPKTRGGKKRKGG